MITQKDLNGKTTIYRGCSAAETSGCFCTGKCKEVIGYLVNGKIELLKPVGRLNPNSIEYTLKNKPDGTY